MGNKISRREFLKKWSILGLGTIFAASKFGRMPDVKAAVSDNAEAEDISKDIIRCSSSGVFTSGETAEDLADAVNGLNNSFSEALTDLKATDVATFVGAQGGTFTAVIEKLKSILEKKTITPTDTEQIIAPTSGKVLSEIKVEAVTIENGVGKDCYDTGVAATKKGNAVAGDVLEGKTFTSASAGVEQTGTMTNNGAYEKKLTSPSKVTIPAGYHNGSGFVDATGLVAPTGKKTITSNGTYDVSTYQTAEVNVSLSDLLNQELGVTDIEITGAEQLKKSFSKSYSKTAQTFGGDISFTFDMKSLVGITPINYIKITNVNGSFTGASAYHYTGYQYSVNFSGSTMTYTINEGVVTVTFHMSGCSITAAEFYTPTCNFSVSIKGYVL